MIASVSRMLPRNLLPRPSPFEAPFTKPAISTISQVAGTMRPGWTSSANLVRRSSGTVMTPTLGSMVQKGKFAAWALALDRQLNKVDLPTLGSPTIPHFKAISLSWFFYSMDWWSIRFSITRAKLILFELICYLFSNFSPFVAFHRQSDAVVSSVFGVQRLVCGDLANFCNFHN